MTCYTDHTGHTGRLQPSRFTLLGVLVLVFLFMTGVAFPPPGFCQEAGASLNGKPFHLSINRPEGDPYHTWVALTYTEIFRRLALPLTTEYYPLKRASEEADAGRIDGEGGRIITYGKSFQNLARVEEPVFMMSVIAYAADPSISDLNGWESLKTFEGLVESPRGMKISEINLSNVVKAEKLSTITEASQALRKLAINRIDLYVDDMNAVAPILLNPEYDLYDLQGKIHVAGIMEEVPLYMYVHKKHQALAPKLSEVIKMVKSEGLIEQYRQTAFGIHDEKGD